MFAKKVLFQLKSTGYAMPGAIAVEKWAYTRFRSRSNIKSMIIHRCENTKIHKSHSCTDPTSPLGSAEWHQKMHRYWDNELVLRLFVSQHSCGRQEQRKKKGKEKFHMETEWHSSADPNRTGNKLQITMKKELCKRKPCYIGISVLSTAHRVVSMNIHLNILQRVRKNPFHKVIYTNVSVNE